MILPLSVKISLRHQKPLRTTLFELVLAVSILVDVNASLFVERYSSSSNDGSRQDTAGRTKSQDRTEALANNIRDLRVLDGRQSVLVVQVGLGLAVVDLGAVGGDQKTWSIPE